MQGDKEGHVRFTPDGLVGGLWDEKNSVYVPYIVDNPLRDLRSHCLIEGATLRNIMEYVRGNELLSAFISSYSWCNVEAWNSILDKPAHNEEHGETIHFHEIGWVFEVCDYGVEEWLNLSMVGEVSEDTKKHCPEYKEKTEHYGYGGIIEPYLDLPVILDEKIKITDHRGKKFGEKSLVESTKIFTLLDILDAIYWEISFYGNPSDTKELFEDLCQQIEGIKSGEIKTVEYKPGSFKKEAEKRYQDKNKDKKCPVCKKFHGRDMKNYSMKKKTGDICCRKCGTVVKKYKKVGL